MGTQRCPNWPRDASLQTRQPLQPPSGFMHRPDDAGSSTPTRARQHRELVQMLSHQWALHGLVAGGAFHDTRRRTHSMNPPRNGPIRGWKIVPTLPAPQPRTGGAAPNPKRLPGTRAGPGPLAPGSTSPTRTHSPKPPDGPDTPWRAGPPYLRRPRRSVPGPKSFCSAGRPVRVRSISLEPAATSQVRGQLPPQST